MRADRLVATLLVMQARGRVTAAELARELEVSVATARRDLVALSSAGIPVYPQPGRGGGWQLLGEGRTDLSGLTSGEARALFLLLGTRGRGSPEARGALRKVLRALPETFRGDAQAAAGAVLEDDADWERRASDTGAVREVLADAIVERRVVRIRYAPWNREPGERIVRPLGLVDHRGTWYLIADADAGRRTYRLDRMSDADPLVERFEPPADFDLGDAWAEVATAAAGARRRSTAIVLVEPESAAEFCGWAREAERIAVEPDGRIRVRVAGPSDDAITRAVAGWAEVAEVVEPRELRERLARLGAAAVARYGG
ncbi:WYL domain-containing protein [Agromyces tropicus]|uniref:WYL domain-containing protein n=1 Tax=Agromyces tropicus TaxID=555371 RepID=A0ABP5G119_9MICO